MRLRRTPSPPDPAAALQNTDWDPSQAIKLARVRWVRCTEMLARSSVLAGWCARASASVRSGLMLETPVLPGSRGFQSAGEPECRSAVTPPRAGRRLSVARGGGAGAGVPADGDRWIT